MAGTDSRVAVMEVSSKEPLVRYRSRSQLLALLLLVMTLVVTRLELGAADSIQGCGGFVETSTTLGELRKPTDPKLDYSHTTVELHTLDGLRKDRTQCAPNGYYFLPVYDRGTFVIKIKGPDGWSFEPKHVKVVVDQNGCNDNEDINFRYTGFTLSGKVLSEGRSDGPAGVKVSLSPIDKESQDSGSTPFSVTTSPGGGYEFVDLPPRKYHISASHPKWIVGLKRESAEVELGWDNSVVEDVFSVAGYDIEGSVASQGNPVLGVQIYLYSDDVSAISCPQGPGRSDPLPGKQALCHVFSNAEGRFKFSTVPCGQYKLVPIYQGENTVFDVSPSSIDLTVENDSVEIVKSFQVTGFSIGGRVIDTQGFGIEGVKMLIEDVERATTDAQGFYKLDQVTSTEYTIRASKANYKFSSLENFKVLPNMASVPEIKATHYAVCGSISIISLDQAGKRQVALTHGPVKPQTKRANEDGSFCFEVPPGDYRLSPLTTQAETKTGLLFTPSYLDITVSGPILDATFSQAQVSVSGVVKFKGPSSPLVVITLSPLNLADTSKIQRSNVAVEAAEFFFEKVLPGNYRLEIRHKPATEEAFWDDDWSWEQKTLEVDVGTEDVTGLVFVQKGYLVRINSTHAARAFTLQENKDASPFQIEKGWQEVSLESPGIYELGFLWPCVFFGAMSFQLDTSNLKPLHLFGQKYVLTGHLLIDSKFHQDPNTLGDHLFVDIWQDGASLEIGVHLVSEANATHPVAVYKYAHWAQLGDKLVFSPRHDSKEGPGEEKVLFYPNYQKFHVETHSCQPEIPAFNGRPGVYITGSVVPPLEGVNITILPEKDSEAGSLKSGEIALRTLSEKDGTFRAGPLYDDTGYSVQAAKEGFYLKSIRKYQFSVQKLGQIVVNIIPGEGAEESLPAVLLSLSGDDGYRKNAGAGNGRAFIFENLFPGSFYLRPLLKEYGFSPPAQAIEVGSGETKVVTFSAQRFAYSVVGTVTSLSGKPEEGVFLEARSEKGYYEETITDGEGRYRLRGLLPDTTYTIKTIVKEGCPLKMERSSPSSIVIEVAENDTTGVQFVVFEEAPTTILTGTVEGANVEKWQPDILVELVSATESGKVRQNVPLPLSGFFEVQGLPNGIYTVRLLVRGLQSQTHKFVSDAIEVDLETASQVHIGTLSFTVEEFFHSQDLTTAPVLPLVVAVAAIAVFITLPKLKDAYQSIAGSNWSSSPPKPKTEVRKVVGRTKRAF